MKKAEGPITNLDDVMADVTDQVVELSGWSREKPFVAKLRRVNLMGLAAAGKVPNHLVGAVLELYAKGKMESGSKNIKALAETMLMIASQCLVEPTFAQLEERGIELTDMQLTEIYTFSQQGVSAFRPFRDEQSVSTAGPDCQDVARAAQRVAGSM